MRDVAFTALVLAILPFILRRPVIGLLTYAWLSLMTPYRYAFGFAHEFPFVLIVAVCTLISIALNRDQVRYDSNGILMLLLALPLWTCVTTLFALERESAVTRLEEVLKSFLFVHICAMLLRTRQQIHWMLWVIVISVGFYGIKGGIFTIATGGGGRVLGPPGKSYLTDNNSIAVAMILVIPLMHYLRLVATSMWVRHGLLAAMGLSAMAVLGTFSRGGFLAVCVMLVYLWLKSSRKLLAAILVVPLIPLAIGVLPKTWFDRMDTISTYEEDGSAMSRITTWTMLFNVANDRPLVGGGFEMYSPRTSARYSPAPDAVHSAHSIYFQTLGEHGYVGFLIFVSIGISTWVVARRTIARARGRDDLLWSAQLARAIQVSLIGYAVGGAFVNIGYWDLYYYLVVIMVLVHRLAAAPVAAPVVERERVGVRRAGSR